MAKIEMRRWYISRPSWDQDVKTETTSLHQGLSHKSWLKHKLIVNGTTSTDAQQSTVMRMTHIQASAQIIWCQKKGTNLWSVCHAIWHRLFWYRFWRQLEQCSIQYQNPQPESGACVISIIHDIMPMTDIQENSNRNRYQKYGTDFWSECHAKWYQIFLVPV